MKTENITALKIKFVPPTNNKNPRLSITQLNNKKRCFVNCYDNLTTLEQIEHTLKACPCLKNWFVIIDNTLTGYQSFLIGLEFQNNKYGFSDVITEIKDNEKRSLK